MGYLVYDAVTGEDYTKPYKTEAEAWWAYENTDVAGPGDQPICADVAPDEEPPEVGSIAWQERDRTTARKFWAD